MARKPKILPANGVAETVISEPMQTPPTEAAKPKQAARKTKSAPTKAKAGYRPYQGSFAEKCDLSMFAGGTLKEMAERAGTTPGVLKGHVKFRTRLGKFRLEGDLDGQCKLVPVSQASSAAKEAASSAAKEAA